MTLSVLTVWVLVVLAAHQAKQLENTNKVVKDTMLELKLLQARLEDQGRRVKQMQKRMQTDFSKKPKTESELRSEGLLTTTREILMENISVSTEFDLFQNDDDDEW